ncbi:tyrosine-protein kinase receptor torso [Folsomia candida]|uniref:tyrosine-protein kinase receptor torso n=1 Tax=Folsomia candida TaxID=158441 RepID=UPI001604F21E|nr:tyrosine-protein kinase receptor torso [Folsomia candida]
MKQLGRIKQFIFVTEKCNRVGFNSGEWYRVLFLEIMLGIFWAVRLTIKRHTVFEVASSVKIYIWLVIIIAIPMQFVKTFLVWSGIIRRCPTRLRIYCRLSQVEFPLYICFKLLILRNTFLTNSMSFLLIASEILTFLVTSFTWGWLAYWAVPHYLRQVAKTEAAMTDFKRKMDQYLNEGDEYVQNLDTSEYVTLDESFNVVDNKLLLDSLITPLELQIDISHMIGDGQFSLVYKGTLQRNGKSFEIAGKTGKTKENSLEMLVKEMQVILHVGSHPNILTFFGVTCDPNTGSYFLISEFCTMGCLHSYLEKLRPTVSGFSALLDQEDRKYVNITINFMEQELHQLRQTLQRFSLEICGGMCHLALKKVIHGDLAARNVLITKDLRAKLCDFGMSGKLYNYQIYVKNFQQNFLPWRWVSVEALDDLKFSEQSDVWSFGVFLWELYTLGRLPFAGQSWSVTLPDDIRAGIYKLDKPELATSKIDNIIRQCCSIDSKMRPTFKTLSQLLQDI